MVVRPAVLLALVLASVSVAACGQAAPEEGGERLETSASALTANDKIAFDYFLAKGVTPVQAAGIVGNLDQESNMNPSAVQSGGPGRGIAQWSVGGRWSSDPGDNAVAYAAMHGKNVLSLDLQLDFIWFELTTFPSYGLAALKKSTTTTDATLVFMKDFEVCGTCLSAQRISYAQAALAAYGNDPVDAGADASDAATKHDAASADGGPDGSPGTPGPAEADGGPTHETTGAVAHVDEPAADPGGCTIARLDATRARNGTAETWLASLCAAAVLALRRRRPRRR